MPLIKIEQVSTDTLIGIWQATEDAGFFAEHLSPNYLNGFDEERFSAHRKKEFLASRFLLKQLLKDEDAALDTEANGRIKIKSDKRQVSISHCRDYMAAIISSKHRVGIDIEQINSRVKKVMRKFLNESELKSLGAHPETWKVVLCWAAKESIYKMLNIAGLSFANSILLHLPSNEGERKFKAEIVSSDMEMKLTLFFERMDEFILAYCMD